MSGLLGLAVLVVASASLSSCAPDRPSSGTVDVPGVAPTTTTDRPPLDDPPDPGPVPTTDGLDDEVRARAVAATGRVSGVACGRASVGTAFAVDTDLLVTSAHVLVGVDAVAVELADGTERTGTVVAFDGRSDLAVLHVPGAGLEALAPGDAADGTTGAVVAWGASGPEPVPFRIDRPVTVRIDDAARTGRVARPSWLVAARIDGGDSGAPLVDRTGAVVGVAYATTRRDAGVAYAVRASELASVVAAAEPRSPVGVPGC